jgi:hypothetical protein
VILLEDVQVDRRRAVEHAGAERIDLGRARARRASSASRSPEGRGTRETTTTTTTTTARARARAVETWKNVSRVSKRKTYELAEYSCSHVR